MKYRIWSYDLAVKLFRRILLLAIPPAASLLCPMAQAQSTPAITLVANAEGGNTTIAPNTWVEIKGSNLAPAGITSPDCAPGYCWQTSDFVNNQLPKPLQASA
jgi:hypothetical protein